MPRARALMVLGTASHVGKSVLAAALCRILRQDGFDVAPFKAQNMSLNSAATPEGLEIGRAQAMQAEAAGLPPSVDMNPVLLKPSADARSQLVLQGRVAGEVSARDYHRRRARKVFGVVLESYERLAARHRVIVLEGAGSPAEINLARNDIVNMRMAHAARAACLLVADIDRGGVFASLVGTLALLPRADRRRIRGFVVNRFRGDPSLFRSGVSYLERKLLRPCLGVVPYLRNIGVEEEDGVALDERRTVARCWPDEAGRERRLRVGVVALPKMANFTDFDALAAEPSVALAYLTRPADIRRADLVIVPGSKQTLDDLRWLKRQGFASALGAHVAAGGRLLGVCGGMQMLGHEVVDGAGREGGGRARGLAFLGVRTRLGSEKVTRRARATLREPSLFGRRVEETALEGYEIHLGATRYDDGTAPLFRLAREGQAGEVMDGAVGHGGRVIGTYLHGLFDSDAFRHAALRGLRAAAGLTAPRALAPYTAERERRFDRLAEHFRRALDVERIEAWLR
jgi:adenosylcobyric acid synthase